MQQRNARAIIIAKACAIFFFRYWQPPLLPILGHVSRVDVYRFFFRFLVERTSLCMRDISTVVMGVFAVDPFNSISFLVFYCTVFALLDWSTLKVDSAEFLPTFALSVREQATVDDVLTASKLLFLEKMNPYIASRNNLVVMYDDEIKEKKNNLIGFGQIRPLGGPTAVSDGRSTETIQYHELASMYVKPEYRRQGVGTTIVRTLLQRFDCGYPLSTNQTKHIVCALTLKRTIEFYSKYGFRVVPQQSIPPPLKLEYQLGNVLSLILGNDLVCMVRENDRGS